MGTIDGMIAPSAPASIGKACGRIGPGHFFVILTGQNHQTSGGMASVFSCRPARFSFAVAMADHNPERVTRPIG